MGLNKISNRGSHLVNTAISLPLHSLIGDLHLQPNSIFTAVYWGFERHLKVNDSIWYKKSSPRDPAVTPTPSCWPVVWTPMRQESTQTPEMLMFVISFATLVCAAVARPSLSYLENRFTVENESEEVRSAAIKRLLEVFGMEDPPAIHGHKQPPQYMLDLYNTVADVDGVTKDPYLLEGNTVRSFFDKRKIVLVRALVCSWLL